MFVTTDGLYHLASGALLIIVAMVYAWLSHKINLSGAMVGGIIAWLIFMGGSWPCLSLLFIFFFAGSFVSGWKYEQKEYLKLAQENRGKRGVIHALANGGFAALCGLFSIYFYERSTILNLMLASSFAVACSDTFSSELGNVYGRNYFNILNFKKEMRGLDGVVSKEGILWGLAGSLLIAVTYSLYTLSFLDLCIVFICGITGNLLDSVLGATLQRQGMMNNHSVNFFSTSFGGLLAGILLAIFYF